MVCADKSRSASRSPGSVAIEYGLILPALLLFTLGIMDTSRLIWTYTTLYRAVEAAARCGSIDVNRCETTSQIQDWAMREAWGLTIDTSAFTVTDQLCGKHVSASYPFTFIIPMLYTFSNNQITLNATACYPL